MKNSEPKALTFTELKDITFAARTGPHIWVKHLESEHVSAAIMDIHDIYGYVAVWCAGNEDDYLTEETYGKKWLAYLEEPYCEEPKPTPHLNGG